MGKEIERKYLVEGSGFLDMAQTSVAIAQGYLSTDPDRTVRVRIKGDKGYITVKSRNIGAVRGEWEYEVPVADAAQMLQQCCTSVLRKTRYIVPYMGRVWEVDVFDGRHRGLVVAEIELDDENAMFDTPPFIGQEVTGDPRYYNSTLSKE